MDAASDRILCGAGESGRVYTIRISTNPVAGEFTCSSNDIPATPPVNVFTSGTVRAHNVFYLLSVEDEQGRRGLRPKSRLNHDN